jgi:DNA-binding MurR/RpiR family transcriptional regulator
MIVWQRMTEHFETFSPSERKLANFMLEHTDEVPFLSTSELAERTRLSTASVTRFAQRLGYEGYPHLQKEIRTHLRETFAPKVTSQKGGLLNRFWQLEEQNLQALKQIPETELEKAATALAKARRVWVVAGRATQFVAQLAWYDLLSYRSEVQFMLSEHIGVMEQLIEMSAEDVVLVYTIRRYTKATTRLTYACKEQGATVLLITDDGHPPVARIADQIIRVPMRSVDSLYPLSGLTSLTHALVMLTAQRCGAKRFKKLEELIQKADYYEY